MKKCIDPDQRCTGCNACVSICPKNAISLRHTTEGFWYPSVDQFTCTGCSICLSTCAVYGDKQLGLFSAPKVFAGWNENDEVRRKSSSGGVFSLLASDVLAIDGVVYGAAYDKNDWSVKHMRVDKSEDLPALYTSKYVQSYIAPEIYETIQEELRDGRKVLFSGTPCQTAACGKQFNADSNFLSVDIICHGVPSPYAWKCYLDETMQNQRPIEINMREKSSGWNDYHMMIQCDNNIKMDTRFIDNPWGKSFVNNLFLRECCYQCEFKEYIRSSDISLGDFWEAVRGDHPEYDDHDRGTSVILINSAKGEAIIERMKGYFEEIPYDLVPAKTYAVSRSSSRNSNRNDAFSQLNKDSFSKIVKKYTTKTFMKRVRQKLKL